MEKALEIKYLSMIHVEKPYLGQDFKINTRER